MVISYNYKIIHYRKIRVAKHCCNNVQKEENNYNWLSTFHTVKEIQKLNCNDENQKRI